MKNKKVIALICALSMIFSVFASFTIAHADDAKAGIILSTEMSSDYKTATITVSYGEDFYDEGVTGAQINLNLPSDATISYTKPLKEANDDITYAGGNFDANDGIWKLMIYTSDAAAKTADHTVTVITVALADSLSKVYTVELQSGSNIANDTLTLVGESLASASTPIAADPSKTADEPIDKPTYSDDTDDLYKEVVVGEDGGIALETVKVADDEYNIIVTYVGTSFETNGVTGAQINLNLPSDATISYTKPLKEANDDITYAGGAIDANDGIWKLMIYTSDAAAKTEGNVITVITVKYPEAGYTDDKVITLQTGSNVANDEVTIAGEKVTNVTTVLPANVVPSNSVDLADQIDSDKAKNADENADDAYLAIEVTKDDNTTPKYGEDYVAYYDGVQLTEDQMNKLLAGGYEGVSLEDAVKGMTFKYNDGVNIKFQLVADGDVADSGETTSDEPTVTPTPVPAGVPTLSAKSKTVSVTVGKEASVVFNLNKKSFTENGKLVIKASGTTYDVATSVRYSYKNADGDTVSGRITYDDAADAGSITIDGANLPDSAAITLTVTPTVATTSTKKIEFTATYTGENEDGDKETVEATATVTAKESSSGGSSSSSSSDKSSSSGGGAIANGMTDSGSTGFLPGTFTDLGDAEWARQYINDLAAKKIVSGYEDNTFRPNNNITRAEYAQILINAIGKNGESADTYFDDVPTDAWFYHNVAVAAQYGIVSGYGDGNFGPYDLITREQMALMTLKAAQVMSVNLVGAEVGTFADDADIADWSRDAVYTLANAGIINGMGDGTFAPQANATRAQAATIIDKTFFN